MLAILYWVILVLCIIGVFVPQTWPYAGRVNGAASAVLFILIGLRIFRIPLQ